MKKLLLISSVLMLLVLLFSLTQPFVLAADAKAKGETTPGAKATEKALEKAAESSEESGNGNAKQNFKGTLVSIAAGETSLEVMLADGTKVTILVNSKTKLKIPGKNKSVTLADLRAEVEKGTVLTVAVQTTTDTSNNLVARQIHLIPGKPTQLHRVGVVQGPVGDTITVKGADGGTTTFKVTADTKILPKDRKDQLKEGATVTVISPRTFIGMPVAKGIVVHATGADQEGSEEQEQPEPPEQNEPTE